jgi:hypothetical protein
VAALDLRCDVPPLRFVVGKQARLLPIGAQSSGGSIVRQDAILDVEISAAGDGPTFSRAEEGFWSQG